MSANPSEVETVRLTGGGILYRPRLRPTRFAGLSFLSWGGDWRFASTEDRATLGAIYRTKAELLADAERFAASYGFEAVRP